MDKNIHKSQHGYVKRNKYAIITILGLVFLIVATYIEYLSYSHSVNDMFLTSPKTWIGLLKELSFALFIALVISIGIEESSRNELNEAVSDHVKEIQLNVFNSTFGRNIPRTILSEVEDLVLKADFVRFKHRSIYTLTIQLEKNGSDDMKFIVAETTTSYEVRNVSGVTKDFSVRLELEKPPFDFLEKYTSIEKVTINGRPLTEDEIKSGNKSEKDTENFKKFEHKISGIKPNDEVKVECKYKVVKMINDVEIWRSLLPSDGMTLTLSLPKEIADWGVHALHREEVRLRYSSKESRVYEWSVESGVLPHQAIVFWWRCDDASSKNMVSPAETAPAPVAVT